MPWYVDGFEVEVVEVWVGVDEADEDDEDTGLTEITLPFWIVATDTTLPDESVILDVVIPEEDFVGVFDFEDDPEDDPEDLNSLPCLYVFPLASVVDWPFFNCLLLRV